MKFIDSNQPKKIDEIVVNWHLTEACNYSCKYCYSAWDKKYLTFELFRKPQLISNIIDELCYFFKNRDKISPLHTKLQWKNVRLSLAGGEVLLYPSHVLKIAQEAKAKGLKVSLITNGSLLSDKTILKLVPNLSMLGISIDSGSSKTSRSIGRKNASGQALDLYEIEQKLNLARSINPDLFIKINTVVNMLNAKENLTELISRLSPNKWKVFKMLPIVSQDLSVSSVDYKKFIDRHCLLSDILSAENNEDMTESYIMIDPIGRFFQNNKNTDSPSAYTYSQPITKIGVVKAFSQIPFNTNKFVSRYT